MFRDHPEWKRHAYLVLQAGDFRCPQCTVKVTVGRLVFRDHPEWKRHAYLVLQAGDFRCPQCTVKVTV
ncbi:hypothetical protein C7E12_23465, partial [Stenotrophomonas maltophilia]